MAWGVVRVVSMASFRVSSVQCSALLLPAWPLLYAFKLEHAELLC